ncbi:hypothetical protein EDL96_03225 [Kocuria soli]|uniref:Type I restriction modification DNA specificity domain-containing protein n=1 Tax=Kocuria soli TaxID=2485125 RepID=A0A3N3ZS52_9MICC|nr:restriction endonuclease subunit S [Kocuria soli]ROZ64287.1 hypothetical protein EDL96_03225 [Kocuria soli]
MSTVDPPLWNFSSAPAGWTRTTLGRVLRFGNGSDYSDVEVDEPGYPVYGSGGQFRWAKDWLYDGPSILFGRKGTVDRPLYVEGRFWTVDTMYYTALDSKLAWPKFVYYWATRIPFDYYQTNTALPSMTQSDLAGEPILLPPLNEQRAIADFLDHETAEIDAMVSDLEVSLDLLRERRTEVVNQYMYHAVDDRLAIKYLGCLQAGLTLGATYQEPIAEYPYLRVANVQVGRVDLRDVATVAVPERTAKTSRLKAGDVLMTEGGDRDKLGRGALWSGKVDPMLHQNHVFAFRCDKALSPKYLVYALEASEARMYFDLTARQSTNLASTNSTIVKNFKIPRRDILEQEMIVGQIEFEVAEIAQASDDIDRAITLAKERRAALISAAVTGQIDVTAKRKPVAEQLEDDIAQGVHTSS